MKLNKILIATLATGSVIAAQPALAQTSGPASATVDATAEILDSQLTLEIVDGLPLTFRSVTRPNGVVSGAQCRYVLDLSNDIRGEVNVAELRNGAVFDDAFPTPSGCEATDSRPGPAVFALLCTRSTPVTLSAAWQSAGLQGIALTPGTQGVAIQFNGGSAIFDPTGSSVVNCSEEVDAEGRAFIQVRLGGTLTVDADAAVSPNVLVGTVTLNATY